MATRVIHLRDVDHGGLGRRIHLLCLCAPCPPGILLINVRLLFSEALMHVGVFWSLERQTSTLALRFTNGELGELMFPHLLECRAPSS